MFFVINAGRRKGTIGAVRFSGIAYRSAMMNQIMAEFGLALRRDGGFQLPFHHFRMIAGRKPQTVGKTNAVGIGNDGRLAVNIAADEIGGFSSDARKTGQILYIIRHPSIEPFQNIAAHFDDAFRLGAKKTAGMDRGTELFKIGCGKGFQGRVFFKERRRDHVDAGGGTLRRKRRWDQQLIGRGIM